MKTRMTFMRVRERIAHALEVLKLRDDDLADCCREDLMKARHCLLRAKRELGKQLREM